MECFGHITGFAGGKAQFVEFFRWSAGNHLYTITDTLDEHFPIPGPVVALDKEFRYFLLQYP